MDDGLLTVACLPNLPHGAFRLYAILDGVARQRKARDAYFPVTLTGLQRIHPGTSGKLAAIVTIAKQLSELRQHTLIDIRASIDRENPSLPILVKVLYPQSLTWVANDGSELAVADVKRVIEVQ